MFKFLYFFFFRRNESYNLDFFYKNNVFGDMIEVEVHF